jgi:hypothetical protein
MLRWGTSLQTAKNESEASPGAQVRGSGGKCRWGGAQEGFRLVGDGGGYVRIFVSTLTYNSRQDWD